MWLEQQSPATIERINNMLRRFKAQFVGMEITGDMQHIGNQITMDLDNIGEFYEIPAFENIEREQDGEQR